ncbi:hypothetical protein ABZX62_26465 [Streptomyces flavidovirens]|uniref:Transposase n=1 Tax=Streptomyces flavidovirens TaxID=67298 RepID=A0ABW6RN76_9ACTN
MPSVLGLLEAREKKIREELAQLREEAERIMSVLATPEADGGMRARQITIALGEPVIPARVEGCARG